MIFLVLLAAVAVPDPIADARPAIDKANAEWLPALRSGDAETIAAPYEDDGLFVRADGQVVRGRAAIRAMYAAGAAAAARITGGELHTDGTSAAAPDLVYEWGHASVNVRGADGRQQPQSGAYLTVWHKGRDGRWRIKRNLVF